MENIRRVPLEHVHIKLGAKMVPFAGFNMPVRYTSDLEEHHTVRNDVGVFDVSHMGEFRLKGEKVLELLQFVTSNDVSKLVDGKVQYSCLPNAEGGIIDDILVYRYKVDEYYLVVNASNIEKDWNWIKKHNTFGVEITDLSSKLSLLAVQGPKAKYVLQKLTKVDLSAMEYYTFKIEKMADIQNVIISNTGYTGAGGFEIFVENEFAEKMWDAIFEAGKEFNIKPIGLGARDTLRLEKGFCLYGNDIDDTTSPIEAGLSWITKFEKNFINKASLEKHKKEGVSKKLVGFKMIERGIPRSHYEIVNESGVKIGEVTSGTQSPTLGYGIGMGYVKTEKSAIGSDIYIVVRERNLKAEVVKMPFV